MTPIHIVIVFTLKESHSHTTISSWLGVPCSVLVLCHVNWTWPLPIIMNTLYTTMVNVTIAMRPQPITVVWPALRIISSMQWLPSKWWSKRQSGEQNGQHGTLKLVTSSLLPCVLIRSCDAHSLLLAYLAWLILLLIVLFTFRLTMVCPLGQRQHHTAIDAASHRKSLLIWCWKQLKHLIYPDLAK